MASGGKHAKRFKRWRERAPPQTRVMAEDLVSRWAPAVEAQGFCSVDCFLGKEDSPVEGSEIQFERLSGGHIDEIYLFFDKYSSPRFQITFARRAQPSPNPFVRARRLVKQPVEHYHEWGKPRWFPVALWSARQSAATVNAVIKATPQIFAFLETGAVGPNVGRG